MRSNGRSIAKPLEHRKAIVVDFSFIHQIIEIMLESVFVRIRLSLNFAVCPVQSVETAEANRAKLASVSIRDNAYLFSKTDEPTNIYEENIIAIHIKHIHQVGERHLIFRPSDVYAKDDDEGCVDVSFRN